MALAKEHVVMSDTKMGMVDNYDQYYDGEFGMNDHSSPELYGINEEEPPKSIFEECENSEKTSPKIAKNFGLSSSNSSLSSPSSSNSNGHSVINFKGGYGNFMYSANGSLLSFEQSERFCPNPRMMSSINQVEGSVWEDNNLHYQNCSSNTSPRVINENSNNNGMPFGWLNSEANASTTTHVEESHFNKRPSAVNSFIFHESNM